MNQQRAGKYNIRKVVLDGIKFDSPSESEYYSMLKFIEKNPKSGIKLVELQPKVYLSEARILYKPDFLIEERGKLVYVDVKGIETAVFKIKVRLWKAYGVAPLRIVKKSRDGFRVTAEYKPTGGENRE